MKMMKQTEELSEKALRELAMEAQDSVEAVVGLVDTVHRHKLAAKTSQVALNTEVYNLKQKHKSLKKGSQALVKAQKKGKAGPLGGIAREITATLFPSKHPEMTPEVEASAPSLKDMEGKDESPPSYEEQIEEVEANVTRAELDKAKNEVRFETSKAEIREDLAKKVEARMEAKLAAGEASPGTRLSMEEARRQANIAWGAVERAEQHYQTLRHEYEKEEQERREKDGHCGPVTTMDEPGILGRAGTPSVDVCSGYEDGKRQVLIQERQGYNQSQGTLQQPGSLYPQLNLKDEQQWNVLSRNGSPFPKQEPYWKDEARSGRMGEGIKLAAGIGSTHVQAPLQIREIRRVVITLIPGNEIAWATLTQQTVKRVKEGEEAMLLQAIMPQLSGHPEVAAYATMLLVQAANNPAKEKDILNNLFEWILSRYRLTPRQKRANFAQKLKHMQWTWEVNPADVLTGIMTMSQLTWDEVLQNQSLREELEAAMASKLDMSLHLQIIKQEPKRWRQAITEIWEKVKDSVGSKPVEIYMHEEEEDSDSEDEEMACSVEMPSAAVAQVSLPKGKTKIDFRNFDKKLDMVVSALQAQEVGKAAESPSPATGKTEQQGAIQSGPAQTGNPPSGQMQDRPPVRCYWCNQEGHIKRNCPQRNNGGFNNGYTNRGGWNQGRGNWNGNRGGYNQTRNNYNQNRGYGNEYNRNWNNQQRQGRGGYQNQNPQYRGYRNNNPGQGQNPVTNNDKPSWESEAARIRQQIIREGQPKASWAEPPPPPPSRDDQPAIAAEHAEANFVHGLSASERWKSETARPPLAYEQAMAQLAENAPLLQPMELPSVDFLGQRQRI